MKAMVWAAGLGTRLRPLTESRPKAMVPVVGRPMLEHALLQCKKSGITEIMVNTHYFPDTITAYLGDGSAWGLRISYSFETELLENAGALVKVRDFFDNQPFLAFASDNLTDIDLARMKEFHESHHGLATIATSTADDVSRYGIIATDGDDQIASFQEKPKPEEALGDQIATCIYMFEPGIFDHLPKTPAACHFGKEIFPVLLNQKVPLFAYRHDGYWNDVGNPANYLFANFDVFNGRFRADLSHAREIAPRVYVGENTFIHPTASLVGPVFIGNHCHIGANAVIGPETIIGSHCTVEDGAEIERSLLWEHCQVGTKTILWQSVLAEHCKIYPMNQIKNLVLGQNSLVNHTVL
jgi:NDP-sugar pyrophosphorylase family protein